MTIFAFGFFAFLLAFIEANDVAENQLAGMCNFFFTAQFLCSMPSFKNSKLLPFSQLSVKSKPQKMFK